MVRSKTQSSVVICLSLSTCTECVVLMQEDSARMEEDDGPGTCSVVAIVTPIQLVCHS